MIIVQRTGSTGAVKEEKNMQVVFTAVISFMVGSMLTWFWCGSVTSDTKDSISMVVQQQVQNTQYKVRTYHVWFCRLFFFFFIIIVAETLRQRIIRHFCVEIPIGWVAAKTSIQPSHQPLRSFLFSFFNPPSLRIEIKDHARRWPFRLRCVCKVEFAARLVIAHPSCAHVTCAHNVQTRRKAWEIALLAPLKTIPNILYTIFSILTICTELCTFLCWCRIER